MLPCVTHKVYSLLKSSARGRDRERRGKEDVGMSRDAEVQQAFAMTIAVHR